MEDFKNIKIGLVGDSNIGKSCLVSYITNEPFSANYIPTIGVDLKVLYLDNLKLKFTFWDLSGQNMFKDLVDNFVNSMNVICFCFSVDSIDSYNNMISIYNQYYENNVLKDKVCIALQLKCDIMHNVSMGKIFAEENNIKIISTSSLKKFGKDELVIYLIKMFCNEEEEEEHQKMEEIKKNCIIN
jgi:small GTP-binding protein